jgi:transposase
MMGRQETDQRLFFYDFCLDDHVPRDHVLRRIELFLDFDELRHRLKPHYSPIGRPSIDPELMIRMLIVGYCFGIRSERRLCQEVHLNLAYRWFCRLGLEDRVPDHSTFSLNRHGRFREGDAFRLVFESVLRRCMAAGLVGGEGFAIDASVLEADASRYHGIAPDEIDWTDPALNSRAAREYLAALDPEPDPNRATPKVLSPSDPASAWTAKANKRVQFGYGLNYLIDNQHAIIVDVEASPARTYDEVVATRTMIERTDERFGLKPKRLAADTAYGTGIMLDWLIKREIEPHIPVRDMSQRTDGTFSREDFAYAADRDVYICPDGKTLTTTGRVFAGNTLYYRARQADCEQCPLKSRCCPKAPVRRVPRDVNEAARDHARSLRGTVAYDQSARERKKVEMLFAHLKRHLGFERLRLRGLSGAHDEFLLAATVQNLKRLAKLAAIPPPTAQFA